MGGGCYGTFYARQLARAKARGVLGYERVLVVDRDPACQVTRELPPSPDRELVVQDWDGFFDTYLRSGLPAPLPSGPAAQPSYIVPSPLMPHLMFDWLRRLAKKTWPGRAVAQQPLTDPVGTPYDTLAPDGTRYVSWADWLCPTHCIEPATCPVIRAPRMWEMSETAHAVVERLSQQREVFGPALFVTRHLTDGVGAFAVSDAAAAAGMLRDAGASGRSCSLLVGTVSACHGALGLLGLD
ncbi:MAG: hypothetical protein R2910_11775 [Gemmatimonadales bacterium]